MSKDNFYEEMDLKYIEIGYAMKTIDRMNPGKVPFIIPVLTPQMDNSAMKDTKVIQRDKSNIQNETNNVDVSDLQMSNYIYIEIPKELCAMPFGEYHTTGALNIWGTETFDGSDTFEGKMNFKASLSQFFSQGSVDVYRGIVSASTGSSEGTQTFDGSETFKGNGKFNADTRIKGVLYFEPTDQYRYIPKGSKWGIMFIGGDVNMPIVICRLP